MLSFLLALILQGGAFELVRVDGTSMTDTLHDNAIVYSDKTAYLQGDIERGDVVICSFPDRTSKRWGVIEEPARFVKRVVGVPGDHVEIRRAEDGNGYALYVNGVEYADPENAASPIRYVPYYNDVYLKSVANGDDADEYFVMGDNRATSHDSRAQDVGPVTRDMIRGKVTAVVWPLDEAREVKTEAVPVQ